MTPKLIPDLDALIAHLGEFWALYSDLNFRGKWSADLTEEQFKSRLLKQFVSKDTLMFADWSESGELLYLLVLTREFCDDPEEALVWLLYCNTLIREHSDDLLRQMIQVAKSRGIKYLLAGTIRLTNSYSRWIGKFGFQPSTIIYKATI